MSMPIDIEQQLAKQAADMDADRRQRWARLIQRYSAWTHNLQRIGEFRLSPDGIAIEMGYNPVRGHRGLVLVAFPNLDMAKWINPMEFASWPVVTGTCPFGGV